MLRNVSGVELGRIQVQIESDDDKRAAVLFHWTFWLHRWVELVWSSKFSLISFELIMRTLKRYWKLHVLCSVLTKIDRFWKADYDSVVKQPEEEASGDRWWRKLESIGNFWCTFWNCFFFLPRMGWSMVPAYLHALISSVLEFVTMGI